MRAEDEKQYFVHLIIVTNNIHLVKDLLNHKIQHNKLVFFRYNKKFVLKNFSFQLQPVVMVPKNRIHEKKAYNVKTESNLRLIKIRQSKVFFLFKIIMWTDDIQ